jgi:hypothetical protein
MLIKYKNVRLSMNMFIFSHFLSSYIIYYIIILVNNDHYFILVIYHNRIEVKVNLIKF